MRNLVRGAFLSGIRRLSRLFYTHRAEWVAGSPEGFSDVRLAVLLNHTSLFEALLSGCISAEFIDEVVERGLLPIADATTQRPIVGRLFKWMVPSSVSITRRHDSTWEAFLSLIGPRTLVMLFPEGRMKRRGGLDKHGRPMTVRSGVAEVLDRLDDGEMLIIYSEGLHHIHAPGDRFPRLFQEVRCRFERLLIRKYKEELGWGGAHFRRNVMHDLEKRRDRHCRWDEKSRARGGPTPGNPPKSRAS